MMTLFAVGCQLRREHLEAGMDATLRGNSACASRRSGFSRWKTVRRPYNPNPYPNLNPFMTYHVVLTQAEASSSDPSQLGTYNLPGALEPLDPFLHDPLQVGNGAHSGIWSDSTLRCCCWRKLKCSVMRLLPLTRRIASSA